MILTIDVGNIYTGIGIFQEGKLIKNWSFSTDKNRTMDNTVSFSIIYSYPVK